MATHPFTVDGKVIFLDPGAGGRGTPVRSGYRGQFFYDGKDCDAIHTFETEDEVPFGREVDDSILLLNPAHHGRVHEGMIFLIREGPHTISYGRVLGVNEPQCLEPQRHEEEEVTPAGENRGEFSGNRGFEGR